MVLKHSCLSSTSKDMLTKEAWHCIPLLLMEVVRVPCNGDAANSPRYSGANHYTSLALQSEISHVSISKSSITLRMTINGVLLRECGAKLIKIVLSMD